jgi:hypothetical protein
LSVDFAQAGAPEADAAQQPRQLLDGVWHLTEGRHVQLDAHREHAGLSSRFAFWLIAPAVIGRTCGLFNQNTWSLAPASASTTPNASA